MGSADMLGSMTASIIVKRPMRRLRPGGGLWVFILVRCVSDRGEIPLLEAVRVLVGGGQDLDYVYQCGKNEWELV